MKKFLLILLVLLAGVAFWFYVLLGRDTSSEKTTAPESKTTDVQRPKKPVEKTAPATTSKKAAPNSDAGMEFPTI